MDEEQERSDIMEKEYYEGMEPRPDELHELSKRRNELYEKRIAGTINAYEVIEAVELDNKIDQKLKAHDKHEEWFEKRIVFEYDHFVFLLLKEQAEVFLEKLKEVLDGE